MSIDKTINRKLDKWQRPWNVETFDDLYNRDERFFSVLIKGAISFLNRNILMYNKSINHFIFNTGSSYMYVENNGYEFSWNETSGEDYMYMQLPRCIFEMSNVNIANEELSQSFARGNYERKTQDNTIQGYNAEIKRIPIECQVTLHYVLGNFNESIILIQEIIDNLTFQKYFKINYLGNIIQCSIELPQDFTIQLNKIDLGAADPTQRTIEISIKICTNYPLINEASEIKASQTISRFGGFTEVDPRSDTVVITIDGQDMTDGDIFLDLRKFDLDNNGILDESELDVLNEFLKNFDVDKDGEVTQHDMSIIEEDFINEIYNIKWDILSKGTFDIQNLEIIKEFFSKFDFNNDNKVTKYELEYITFILKHLKIFDFDNDLIITYKDLNYLIKFVSEFYGEIYKSLWKDFLYFYNKYIKIKELLDRIIWFLNNDYRNLIKWLLVCEWRAQIAEEHFKRLLKLLEHLIKFLMYDINGDGIIDEHDIEAFTDAISEHIGKDVQVKSMPVMSSIIIHQKDHTLADSSITDVEPIYSLKQIKQDDEDENE